MMAYPLPKLLPAVMPISKRLALWYDFDERSGKTLFDKSGARHHSTLTNGTWNAGRRGAVILFDGIDDYAYTANDIFTQADFTQGIALEAIFKSLVVPEGQTAIISIEGRCSLFTRRANDKMSFFMYDGAYNDALSDEAIEANKWYHAVGNWDGLNMTLYVNGVAQATVDTSGVPTIDAVSRPFMVAANVPTSLQLIREYISLVRIYKRCLSITEIKRLYESNRLIGRW